MGSVSSATKPAEKPKASPLSESTPEARGVLRRAGPQVKKYRKPRRPRSLPKHRSCPGNGACKAEEHESRQRDNYSCKGTASRPQDKTNGNTGKVNWIPQLGHSSGQHNLAQASRGERGSGGAADLEELVSPVSGLRVTNIGQAKGGLSWVADDMPTVKVIAKDEVAPRALRPRNLML
ncbi:unnamed protein product [Echinostoma caproni]|uniref:Chromobox protein homolog 6 n=1 Tax=Echinostoma caproni TaxID=27848 RepID=A0A183BE77_9TREM|nr:unnamed protein product [Echinostoma caproni]